MEKEPISKQNELKPHEKFTTEQIEELLKKRNAKEKLTKEEREVIDSYLEEEQRQEDEYAMKEKQNNDTTEANRRDRRVSDDQTWADYYDRTGGIDSGIDREPEDD